MSIAFNDVWKSASGNGMRKVWTFGRAHTDVTAAQNNEARTQSGQGVEPCRLIISFGGGCGGNNSCYCLGLADIINKS